MKNNKIWIIVAIILILCIGIGIYFFFKNKNMNSSNYSAERTSTNQDFSANNTSVNNNIVSNSQINNTENFEQNSLMENKVNEQNNIQNIEPKKDELISSFSTKIYTKESERQNNISITCSKLNGTVVKNGGTFSFCNTIGPATSAKGYQEADIFDNDGNKKKGLGGGNCQVSTTLYNAVLKVSGLSVIERHEHSNKVPYIKAGKDAAVAYGSYDLKFRNNTGNDIRIEASATANNVSINLYKKF